MPRPRNEQGPTTMVRIDQALYERITELARQHRRSIRAQTSLMLEEWLQAPEQCPIPVTCPVGSRKA